MKDGRPFMNSLGKKLSSSDVLLFLAVVLSLWVAYGCNSYVTGHETSSSKDLTSLYGDLTRSIVQNFETNWLSVSSHENPILQTNLAAGPYLETFGLSQSDETDDNWLVTNSAEVEILEVLQFEPERFKVLAVTRSNISEMNQLRETIRSFVYEFCAVDVFLKSGEDWKLADSFTISPSRDIERDWQDAPPWRREIIGELTYEMKDKCEAAIDH